MKSVSSTAKVLIVFLAIASMAFGQVVTGTILGRVTDATGAIISDAMVQIQNANTGFSQNVQTDAEGRYLVSNLPLGTYTVTVQKTGFGTQVRQGIGLTVGSEVPVNVELAVGNVEQKVEVSAEALPIETTNSTISGLVNQDQMRDLPLNGRDLNSLALLSPGALANRDIVQNASLGLGLSISFNGSRPESNLFLLDGTTVNDINNGGPASAAFVQMGVEGVLEFRVLTHNFTAEYGRNSGAVISKVTRSGTNAFHGSVYEFVRNNVFDARNFFNPGALPAFRRNQFGAAAGGRIIKDKLFFFANWEAVRIRKGTTIVSFVPDANARQGLLPNATGQLQPTTLNPAMVPYLNLFPLPNGPSAGGGSAEYLYNFSQPASENYYMERVDYRFSDKDNFYGRYVYDPSSSVIGDAFPNFQDPTTNVNHFAVLSETHVFSASTLNEIRVSFNRSHPFTSSIAVNPVSSALSFVPGEAFGTILANGSAANIASSFSQLGTTPAAPQNYTQNLFEEGDTFSIIRGAHSLKFGVDTSRIQYNIFEGSPTRGSMTFGSMTNLLAGAPTLFSFVEIGGASSNDRSWRQNYMSWFVQDDYRLSPRLTLNIGLRQEFLTNPTETHGRTGNLLNLTDPTVTPGPAFLQPKANFAPRVGLAWDPTGSGKTSVRVGSGIFYDPMQGRVWYMAAETNSLYLQTFSIVNPPFPNPLSNGIPATALQTTRSVEYHSKVPTVIQYSVEVQQQLGHGFVLRAGYIGSYGYDLPRNVEEDIRVPQIQSNGAFFFSGTEPYINPNFGLIYQVDTDAHFNYNALQTTLEKRLSAGLRFQASYTYSKTMSDADESGRSQTLSTANVPQNPFASPMAEYSLSAYDQRQTFVLNASYQMPWDHRLSGRLAKSILGGWSINGIFSDYTGLPLNVWDSFNNSRDGDTENVDRPNLAAGASQDPIHGTTAGCAGVPAGQQLGTPGRWYDPCAFVLPLAGFYGTLGRNTVTQPGLADVDLALVKTTLITERIKLDFRAEAFNLFNHANFSQPNLGLFQSSRVYNPSSGLITATSTDNRDLQLGLKLMW